MLRTLVSKWSYFSHFISLISILLVKACLFFHENIISILHSGYLLNLQIQELYDEAGIKGFWKGVIPTMIMVRGGKKLFVDTQGNAAKYSSLNDRSATLLYSTCCMKLCWTNWKNDVLYGRMGVELLHWR